MADAAAPPTEQVANLHLDEVTGERISKSELKKRQKARQKEEEKQKKAAQRAATAPPAKKAGGAEAAEKDLTPNQYFEIRSRTINKLRETKSPNPYPHKFNVTYDLRKFVEEFGHLKSGETAPEKVIQIGARIHGKRTSGAKLAFYDVRTEGVKVQVMCQAQEVRAGAPEFADQHEHLRRGDIIGIIGYPGRLVDLRPNWCHEKRIR
jgi:lysyl-tRNA synthetase class 2